MQTEITAQMPALDINSLLQAYQAKTITPAEVIEMLLERIEQTLEYNIWISRLDKAQLAHYLAALGDFDAEQKPLYGIPFAIKDNIDLQGLETTAGCTEYAYQPGEHAPVVERLIAAGAIPLGKTNLDQFATGLVGTRSPYGPGKNSINPDYISGGSSSGSAIAVAKSLVSFSLGTDTAGSGRVPAAFNNLVGLKPTRGSLSTRGVVPACRSLDCVSVFATNADDARRVFEVVDHYDADDAYARKTPASVPGFDCSNFRFGMPAREQLKFFDNPDGEALYDQAVARLEKMGGVGVEIDFQPFLDAARLLYEGPWVAERYLAIEAFIEQQADAMHPVTREIIQGGKAPTATAAFQSQYRLAELKRLADQVWNQVDLIVTPTAGRCYRIDEIEADPIQLNSNLGYYTNFMNLLDYSAIAVPAGFQSDGLPFGVTLFAPAFTDQALLQLAADLELAKLESAKSAQHKPANLLPGWTRVAVCGAHLSGLPLNHQLTDRGAYLLEATTTSENYRLYALPGGPPYRPGLVRTGNDKSVMGKAIEIETWAIPLDQFGSFVAGIPAPLGIGTLETATGDMVQGFLCEPFALEDATEITELGSWRSYLKAQSD